MIRYDESVTNQRAGGVSGRNIREGARDSYQNSQQKLVFGPVWGRPYVELGISLLATLARVAPLETTCACESARRGHSTREE
ncbi:hypothetical protein GCM10007927_12410 [Sulfitobacter pacificus]|uniref:Uncharacterized protein n=1 Tax=Sulfitobacter pacificus TaxID=1499314 RepID=A0ABQ5VHA0_9RHOB|nr:hypothetical protein GCM10007927_12410 [Sulfitobacter pacificus]